MLIGYFGIGTFLILVTTATYILLISILCCCFTGQGVKKQPNSTCGFFTVATILYGTFLLLLLSAPKQDVLFEEVTSSSIEVRHETSI